jgi:uncharacterized protein (DUF305 family)
MTITQGTRAARLALAAALCIGAACARKQDAPTPDAQGHDMAAMPGMTTSDSAIHIPDGADYTVADVRFMQGMIHHHAQALVMSRMAATHGAGKQVLAFCKKIDISQNDEIHMMQTWLRERRQTVPDPADAHPMMMPGMLTDEQLRQLDAARGVEFDRLFLTFMIQHHNGAIDMVADLFKQPGAGQAPEMFRYASDIDADQRGEIGRMQDMLAALPSPSPR